MALQLVQFSINICFGKATHFVPLLRLAVTAVLAINKLVLRRPDQRLCVVMAKAQAAARFMTEVAPPQVVSIMRRRKVSRSLETIAEEDREQLAYGPDHGLHYHQAAAANSSGFAAAWPKRAPPQARARTGKFTRELSKYFSDAHGQDGSWEESGHKGHRRVVYAQQLRKNGA
ncbi:uncharacterized protein LOC133918410 [Phragmites australis]|uniref:uncharacterized protein LOC133918410 n=1 Tax=Phragmites australis TaxID=29695 RepID=UPI002D781A39|nr:uncharacterized protein LOC133918410 [Phragmites australis]